MQRDRLLLVEVIDAAERIIALTADRSPEDFDAERDRRDALLWNFTVPGEAVAQLSETVKRAHPDVEWSDPVRVRNRIVHGYWSVDLDILVAAGAAIGAPMLPASSHQPPGPAVMRAGVDLLAGRVTGAARTRRSERGERRGSGGD